MATLADFGWQRMGTVPKTLPLVVAVIEYDDGSPMTPPSGTVGSPNDPSGLLDVLANRVFGSAAGARTVRNWWRDCFDSDLVPYMASLPVVGPITLPLGVINKPEADRVQLIKTRVAEVLTGLAADFSWADRNKDQYIDLRSELPLLVFDNYTATAGVNRDYGPGSGTPAIKGLTGSLAACGWQASLLTICHELMHVFGAIDIYGAGGLNERYSPMGLTPGGVPFEDSLWCPDPFHRLQMGISTPRLREIGTAGSEVVRAVSDQERGPSSAALLYSKARGLNDWLMVEFRTKDRMDADTFPGFIVWQVALDGNGDAMVLKSLSVAGGLDRAVNVLGKPKLERGLPAPWADGDLITPTWADGTPTGIDLLFMLTNDDRRGRVIWGPTGTPLIEVVKAVPMPVP